MKTIAQIYPDRAKELHKMIGPNFGRCLALFTSYAEMSRKTGIPSSSLSHMMNGRNPDVAIVRNRHEKTCQLYLASMTEAEPLPQMPLSMPDPEPVEQNGLLFVSVPRDKVAKFRAICAMFGCDIVDLDD